MNCTHDHNTLVLHYYGELTSTEEGVLRTRLAHCDACRSAWQDLQADMQVVDGLLERRHVGAADLQRVRASVRLSVDTSVRSGAGAAPARRSVRVQVLGWAASVAAAFLVFATGWYLGVVDNEAKWADAVLFDSHSQQVRIDYVGDSASSLSGSIHDAPMQRELGFILASNIDPMNRMRAARALASARIAPNVHVTNVLSDVLESDENPVIRLQAVRALHRLYTDQPLPESLRRVLVERVEVDANTAVRMKAMELLVASEQVSVDMRVTMERVGSDDRENPYIRFMANRVLDSSGSLERLSGE